MRHDPEALLLYHPVNQQELDLIAALGWVEFPPRLAEQAIFYPVLTEEDATQLARNWDGPAGGVGYVLRFAVEADYAATFEGQRAKNQEPEQVWIPAAELAEFNRHILGQIEVVAVFEAD